MTISYNYRDFPVGTLIYPKSLKVTPDTQDYYLVTLTKSWHNGGWDDQPYNIETYTCLSLGSQSKRTFSIHHGTGQFGQPADDFDEFFNSVLPEEDARLNE